MKRTSFLIALVVANP
ncbi:MAG: hypothetical protein VW297_03675, partial [Paracoccaceae bacterium]